MSYLKPGAILVELRAKDAIFPRSWIARDVRSQPGQPSQKRRELFSCAVKWLRNSLFVSVGLPCASPLYHLPEKFVFERPIFGQIGEFYRQNGRGGKIRDSYSVGIVVGRLSRTTVANEPPTTNPTATIIVVRSLGPAATSVARSDSCRPIHSKQLSSDFLVRSAGILT